MALNTPITDLDFLQIKNNLKEFLKGQDRFKDYDFEGSNMSVLLDVLAYNTFQNNFYTNMTFSEMFLDSAQLRESVVSHAKELNYLPRSRSSARAAINVTLNVSGSPAFVNIPAKTMFKAVCGSKTFNFFNTETVTIFPVGNTYTYYGLDIFEGRYVTENYVVTGNSNQKFVLSNANVDVNSISLTVRDNTSDTTSTSYTKKASIFGVAPTDNVYYIQPAEDEKYEIKFGNNAFGIQPVSGNIITVEYRISSGEEANGITSFAAAQTINGYSSTVALASASAGGAEKESIESIKFFAPKSIQVQDRAITESDYEILLKNNFPEVKSVLAYGGDLANPPQFGKVIVTVQQQEGRILTANDSAKYRNFLSVRSPIAIEPLIRSAEYMYIEVDTIVSYDPLESTKTEADIRQSVYDAVLNYSSESLEKFKSAMKYSKFVTSIDNADPAVVSNDTLIRAIVELTPRVGVETSFNFSFENELKPNADSALRAVQSTVPNHPFIPLLQIEKISRLRPAVTSSLFTYNGTPAYIQDDATGVLNIINISTTGKIIYLKRGIGSVNYDTGEIILTNLTVDGYSNGKIKMYATTDTSNILAPKTRILAIRPEDLKITTLKQ
jgi:hypothetical protein